MKALLSQAEISISSSTEHVSLLVDTLLIMIEVTQCVTKKVLQLLESGVGSEIGIWICSSESKKLDRDKKYSYMNLRGENLDFQGNIVRQAITDVREIDDN